MQEYRGYYESSTGYVPLLGLELFAQASNLITNRLHWQSSVEIICRLRGEVTVTVEGRACRLGPGDVLVIDSHLAHEYTDGTADGLQLLLLVGDGLLHRDNDQMIWLSTLGQGALSRNDPEINALRTHCGRLAEMCWGLYRSYYYVDVPPSDRQADWLAALHSAGRSDLQVSSQLWHTARAELHSLLAILLRHTVPVTRNTRRIPTEFVRCVEYVQSHFAEPLTADDVARACGFSRRSVFRLFHNHMGIPLREYLSFLRVQAACSLLQGPSPVIAEVAARVGLSESQFYRVFQEITGMTPGEWQRATPGQGQMRLQMAMINADVMDLLVQNRFQLYPDDQLDWDWLTGRKGWDFPDNPN